MLPSTRDTLRTTLDYDAADWFAWNRELKLKFGDQLPRDLQEPEHMFSYFLTAIQECNHNHIPTKKLCKHSKPFWSNNLSRLSKKLQDAQKKNVQRCDPVNKSHLETCKAEFQETLITEKNTWIHRKLEGLNTRESLEFWKRYKKQFSPTTDTWIGHIKTGVGNEITNDDTEKEKIMFATYFTGQHLNDGNFDEDWLSTMEENISELKERNWDILDTSSNPSEPENIPTESQSSDENFENENLSSEILQEDVRSAIAAQTTAGKCKDMDGFHPLLLKKLPGEAICFLTTMFNKVLNKGKWIWESAMVSFIRKMDKDSYLLPGSFRPITISSYISKIFERILQRRLLFYCQRRDVIDTTQEGFLPQRSTTRYLYKMTASVIEARRRKMSVMLLFLDFEKAFDSVPTIAMIHKLNMLGVSGSFLRLINSFLDERFVTLKLNNLIGPKRQTGQFGLPQGSVLSPLLFVIYVSDLLQNVHLATGQAAAVAFKYADDGSVMVAADSMSACYNHMQRICDNLSSWCKRWRLVINCSKNKTEAVIVRSRDSASTVLGNLTISGKEIQYVKKSKVLGVIVDEEMSFKTHAQAVLKSCWFEWHRLSSLTTRKRGLNCSTLTILFKTAVLTKLLYSAPVWLYGNEEIFKAFLAKVLFKISGSQFYSSNAVLEVLFGIAPISLTLEIMTVKFLLKGLSLDDDLRAVILQIEETPSHRFYNHVSMTKKCIAWKREEETTARSIQLLDLSEDEFWYSQGQMQLYLCSKWDKLVVTNDLEHFVDKYDAHALIDAKKMVNTFATLNVSVFSREEKRVDNTNLIDFLHGHCLRFQRFKQIASRSNTQHQCLDCNAAVDSPTHKLFHCQAFAGIERDCLINLFEQHDGGEPYIMLKIQFLFSTDVGIRNALKTLVRSICCKSLFDDCYTMQN